MILFEVAFKSRLSVERETAIFSRTDPYIVLFVKLGEVLSDVLTPFEKGRETDLGAEGAFQFRIRGSLSPRRRST